MAILRSKEIWDMEVDEIQEKLVELRTELFLKVQLLGLMKTLEKLEN